MMSESEGVVVKMQCGWGQQYCSACPNLDFYLAPPPRQLKTSLDSCPQLLQCRGQSIAAAAAVAAAGHTLDLTPALLSTDRDGYQTGDEEKNDDWANYISDLLNMVNMLPEIHRNESIRVRFGDDVQTVPYPLFTKARTIGDECALVLPLNYDRHFGPAFYQLVQEKDGFKDFPFLDKISKVFWRGATTAYGWDPTTCHPDNQRRALVERWGLYNDIRVDVGISILVQEVVKNKEYRDYWTQYAKSNEPYTEQLFYRYLLAVEGNDVASGLKWMLASNSVVFMAPPRVETWAMESLLQPWEHFIPVRPDFSDLLDKVEWCERHLDVCHAVSKRATGYIRYFRDKTKAYAQGAAKIQAYVQDEKQNKHRH